jgi:hypothetical protein
MLLFYILDLGSPTSAYGGNNTSKPHHSTSNVRKTIHVDGVVYRGNQALQNAIQACNGSVSCSVDARNSSIGNQIFIVNPFANPQRLEMPITIYTGAYRIQWDVSDDHAVTVDLPSNLKWVLNGTSIRPSSSNTAIPKSAFLLDTGGRNGNDGGSGQGILNTRVYGLDGSIAAGSDLLTVSDPTHLRVGMAIAVVGGVGGMVGQQTTLDGAITSTSMDLAIASVRGFPQQGSSSSTLSDYNYIIVENEIIGWSGLNGTTLQNLKRGQFGTKIENHSDKAIVSGLGTLVTDITGIEGSTVTLLDKSRMTLSNTQVQVGARNVSVQGKGIISGNYLDRTLSPTGNVAVGGMLCYVCSSMTIGKLILFTNLQHAGVFFVGGRHNMISGRFRRIGRPSAPGGNGLGADIFLFGKASKNVIRSTTHENGNFMILIDDRSAEFNRLSGPSNDNEVVVGVQEGPEKYNSGVGVEGYSSRNRITVGRISVNGTSSNAGLYVDATNQWPSDIPIPTGNRFFFAAISSLGVALRTSNYSSVNSSNFFDGGVILHGSTSLASPSDHLVQKRNAVVR